MRTSEKKKYDITPLKLKEIREELGISAYELSRISGVDASNISEIEKERKNASLNVLVKLAEALNCPLDCLVYGTGEFNKMIASKLIELQSFKVNIERTVEKFK